MMTIEDQVIDKTLSSVKIDQYECLTGGEILPSNQQQIIEQAKFTYFPLGRPFEKHAKTIEGQGKKQINTLKSLESLKLKELKPEETKPIMIIFLKGWLKYKKITNQLILMI